MCSDVLRRRLVPGLVPDQRAGEAEALGVPGPRRRVEAERGETVGRLGRLARVARAVVQGDPDRARRPGRPVTQAASATSPVNTRRACSRSELDV